MILTRNSFCAGRVEAQLAAALAASELSIDHSQAATNETTDWIKSAVIAPASPTPLSTDQPTKKKDHNRGRPTGWLGLGGYVIAASIGIGVSRPSHSPRPPRFCTGLAEMLIKMDNR